MRALNKHMIGLVALYSVALWSISVTLEWQGVANKAFSYSRKDVSQGNLHKRVG